jgi:SAM-dependent methyltransferase
VKLNIGCGRNIRDGFVNVDHAALPGVDLVAELDDPDKVTLPYADDSVDGFLLSHVIEHIRYPLPLMQELWRVAEPAAAMVIRCPYGSSDDAWEDPTHVRAQFLNSFGYFGQGAYHRADYGYRGDWHVDGITLRVSGERYRGYEPQEIAAQVMAVRNVVVEMVAQLLAVKPLRDPATADFSPPPVTFELV